MKSLVYIVIALTLALASCSRDRQALSQMDRAEALMFDHPDSALAIMDSIPAGSLRSERARALYALLLTQARDKNYIDQTDDSLISIAVKYFDRTDDTRHRMLAYLYLGRVKLYSKNTSEAIRHLLQAEKYAREIKDTFNLAQIYGNLGEIYGELINAPLQMKYAQMEYDLILPWGHPDYTAWAQAELVRAFINNFQHEKADSITSVLLNQKELLKQDIALYASILTSKSRCKYTLEDYASADCYLDTLYAIDSTAYTIVDAGNHVVSCHKIGKQAKGDSILNKYFKSDSEIIPSYIHATKKDYKKAYRSLWTEYDSLLVWFKNSLLQQASISSEDFHQNALKDEEAHSNRLYNFLLVTIVVMILLILLGYSLLRQKIEREKRRSAEFALLAHKLREDADKLTETNNNLAKKLKSLFSDRFKVIDRLSKTYYECKGMKNEQNRIYTEANAILKTFENTNTKAQLTALIDENLNGLASDFATDFPEISGEDYMLFLYIVCGFSISPISMFLGKSNTVLYNRKSRLKNKITASKAERKSEYLNFLSR